GVHRAGGVVVPADAADAAGDEVRIARVLALHEHRVAAEDRRGALALHHLVVVEIDLGIDAEIADDPGDRVPRHLGEVAARGAEAVLRGGHRLFLSAAAGSRRSARAGCGATSARG